MIPIAIDLDVRTSTSTTQLITSDVAGVVGTQYISTGYHTVTLPDVSTSPDLSIVSVNQVQGTGVFSDPTSQVPDGARTESLAAGFIHTVVLVPVFNRRQWVRLDPVTSTTGLALSSEEITARVFATENRLTEGEVRITEAESAITEVTAEVGNLESVVDTIIERQFTS